MVILCRCTVVNQQKPMVTGFDAKIPYVQEYSLHTSIRNKMVFELILQQFGNIALIYALCVSKKNEGVFFCRSL